MCVRVCVCEREKGTDRGVATIEVTEAAASVKLALRAELSEILSQTSVYNIIAPSIMLWLCSALAELLKGLISCKKIEYNSHHNIV